MRWRKLTRIQPPQVQFDWVRSRWQRDAGEEYVAAANVDGVVADATIGSIVFELLTQVVVFVEVERNLILYCIVNPKESGSWHGRGGGAGDSLGCAADVSETLSSL